MRGLFKCWIVGTCLFGLFLVNAEPAWGYNIGNNFNTMGLYGTQIRRWINLEGRLFKIPEVDPDSTNNAHQSTTVDDFGWICGDGSHWDGITFAVTSCSNARLFVSMTTYETYRGWGTHTGGDDSANLIDTSILDPENYHGWGYNYEPVYDKYHRYALNSMIVKNLTDGSEGTVPDNGLVSWAEVQVGLTGGDDGDFDTGDEYEILCTTESCSGAPGTCKPYDEGIGYVWVVYGQVGNDILISELGHNCSQPGDNYVYLYRDLLGTGPRKIFVYGWNLRFNPNGNGGAGSLFIGVNEDLNSDTTPAMVYEIDLELTTVLRTFAGPNVGDEGINIAVNPDDNKLYAIAANMGSTDPVEAVCDVGDTDVCIGGPNDGEACTGSSCDIGGSDLCVGGPNDGMSCASDDDCPDDCPEYPVYGDLIAWDLSGGSTSSYTTLVDSDANGGYPNWDRPQFIAYRGTNNPSGRPTILVDFKNSEGTEPTIEFYLDETDPAYGGWLNRRGYPFIDAFYRTTVNGQLDVMTGALWIACRRGEKVERGVIRLDSDDSHQLFVGEGKWFKFRDVATPGFVDDPPCPIPPYIITNDINDDLGDYPDDSAYMGVEYTMQMRLFEGYTDDLAWALVQKPDGAVIDADTGLISGWVPDESDLGTEVTFQVSATNSSGSDSDTWQVGVFDPNVVLSNGFRKDWVYQVGHIVGVYEHMVGRTATLNEEDGEIVNLAWSPHNTNWFSLTFSGMGDDTRLFATRSWPLDGPYTDLSIVELDTDAKILNSAVLGVLAGVGMGNLGDNAQPQNIRYNAFNDTLMIGINPDDNDGTSNPLVVYEVDLGLTTVVATYHGPDVISRGVGLDVNPLDGALYVTNYAIGSTVVDQHGDVIAYDTSGGSTSSYTVLIDGDEYAAGDAEYTALCSVVYRGTNNPSGRPTILLLRRQYTQLEFYLDETDVDGNLVKRAGHGGPAGPPFGAAFNGQLDEDCGTVWIVQGFNGDEFSAGMIGLKNDDTIHEPLDLGLDWSDVDSPPPPPICNTTVFADADEDGDVDQDDFAVFQICYTGLGGGIPTTPAYCRCFDKAGAADIDAADFAEFEKCVTGPGIPWSQSLTPNCDP